MDEVTIPYLTERKFHPGIQGVIQNGQSLGWNDLPLPYQNDFLTICEYLQILFTLLKPYHNSSEILMDQSNNFEHKKRLGSVSFNLQDTEKTSATFSQ